MPYPNINPLDWTTVQPHVDALLAADLSHDSVDPWLQQWSDLAAVLQESAAQIKRAVSENTADQEAEQRFLVLVEQIIPQTQLAEQALRDKLLALPGYTPAADTAVMLRQFQAEASIFRKENVPILSDLMKLANEYDKTIGGLAIEWNGRSETIPQAMLHWREPERDVREKAWRLVMACYGAERQKLNDLYMQMVALRRQVARNASLPDFRAYQWLALGRFDYTPQDCFIFHDAIEHEVVPLARQLYDELKAKLDVETLRPWDLEADPYGAPLSPFQDVTDLEEGAHRIFHQVDPALATHFGIMRNGNLDLASRPNKAPGGYCQSFPVSRKPYIFMNAVGTDEDMRTVLHEGGHSFHFMESSRHPLV
jgi:oligoendopeptidase F